MTTQQPGLFPEPEHVAKQPTEPRYYILDAADAQAFDDTATALTLGQFHTLQAARDQFDSREWLYDSLADTLHKPGEWPDTEEIAGLTAHLRALAEVDA